MKLIVSVSDIANIRYKIISTIRPTSGRFFDDLKAVLPGLITSLADGGWDKRMFWKIWLDPEATAAINAGGAPYLDPDDCGATVSDDEAEIYRSNLKRELNVYCSFI